VHGGSALQALNRTLGIGILIWGGLLQGVLFSFNYDTEVPPVYQRYYARKYPSPAVSKDRYPNLYMAALSRLRNDDPKGATALLRGAQAIPLVDRYGRYVELVSAIQSGRQYQAKSLEREISSGQQGEFLSQLSKIELIDYDLRHHNPTAAQDRISELGTIPPHSEIEEKLLYFKVNVGIDTKNEFETLQAYRQLIATYPESDIHQYLLGTIRRRFAKDYRLSLILDSGPLRSAYIFNLSEAGRYRDLIAFVEEIFPQHAEFGTDLPAVLKTTAHAYLQTGNREKARQMLFLLLQEPQLPDELMTYALSYHSMLTLDIGTPHYNEAYAIRGLQMVINQYPKSPYVPMALYTLGHHFMHSRDTASYDQIVQKFKAGYGNSPYFKRLMWEQDNPKREGIPISYPASVILAQPKLPRPLDPITQKYDALYQMGLGQLAIREIEYLNGRDNGTESLRLAHIRLLLKTGQFAKAMAQIDFYFGGVDGTMRQLPPSAIRLAYPQIYWNEIVKQCKLVHLDPYYALAVIREDSQFEYQDIQMGDSTHLLNIKTPILKEIAQRLGDQWSPRKEFMTPERSIRYGVYYLAWLRDQFDGNLFATTLAYATNPELTVQFIRTETNINHRAIALLDRIPYPEVQHYVQNVLDSYVIYSALYPSPIPIKSKAWKSL